MSVLKYKVLIENSRDGKDNQSGNISIEKAIIQFSKRSTHPMPWVGNRGGHTSKFQVHEEEREKGETWEESLL